MSGHSRPPAIRWNRSRTEVEQKRAALQASLKKSTQDMASIHAALADYRASRTHATEQLEHAIQKICTLLNERQQAQIVALGLLE